MTIYTLSDYVEFRYRYMKAPDVAMVANIQNRDIALREPRREWRAERRFEIEVCLLRTNVAVVDQKTNDVVLVQRCCSAKTIFPITKWQRDNWKKTTHSDSEAAASVCVCVECMRSEKKIAPVVVFKRRRCWYFSYLWQQPLHFVLALVCCSFF